MRPNHIGLYVQDLDRMSEFYRNVLGLSVSDSLRSEELSVDFLTSDPADHHQVALIAGRPDGVVSSQLINQISFEIDDLAELQKCYHRVVARGCPDIEAKTHGNAWSVYFRDPEGNRLEIFVDTPWYVYQPHMTPIDFNASIEEIYAFTEQICRADPSFATAESWRAKMAKRMADEKA